MARRRRRGRRRRDSLVFWSSGTVGINLDRVARVVEKHLIKDIKSDAAKGQSGDDKPLPPLTKKYAARKRRAGKTGVADFSLTGNLLKALMARGRRRSKKGWIGITISVANRRFRQLVGLVGQGRFLLGVSRSDVKEIAAAVNRVPVLQKKPGKPPVG